MDVNAITDVPGQLTKGDIEIVQGFGEPNIYYDEKANSKPSDGLLVELLQSAEPFGAVPQSLGWFYNLTECNYILMGYYMGKDSSALLSAYKVDLKHLRRWFYNLKQLLENKSVTVTSHIAPGRLQHGQEPRTQYCIERAVDAHEAIQQHRDVQPGRLIAVALVDGIGIGAVAQVA